MDNPKVNNEVIKCPQCSHENPTGAKFCLECGGSLALASPNKKGNLLPIFLILAILIGLAVLCNLPKSPGTVSKANPTKASISIEYRVTGSTKGASLTINNQQGNTEQMDVTVPWSRKFTPSTDFLYVSAQNLYESGTVKCEILVNGKVISEAISSGAFKIATCSFP